MKAQHKLMYLCFEVFSLEFINILRYLCKLGK